MPKTFGCIFSHSNDLYFSHSISLCSHSLPFLVILFPPASYSHSPFLIPVNQTIIVISPSVSTFQRLVSLLLPLPRFSLLITLFHSLTPNFKPLKINLIDSIYSWTHLRCSLAPVTLVEEIYNIGSIPAIPIINMNAVEFFCKKKSKQ